MRNNSQAKLLSRLRLLAETHPTYSRAQVLTKNTQHFLVFSFFYANIFPFLSSPCSPSVNITREQALENRTELFLKGQSCKWPKTFFVNGWGEGRLGACRVSTVRNTWPGGGGKGLPLPPLVFCVKDWGQRVAIITARCLARAYWAGRSAVPLIRGCALNKVLRECGGGWAWCSTVLMSNRLEQIASWPTTLWHFLHTFKQQWTRKFKRN